MHLIAIKMRSVGGGEVLEPLGGLGDLSLEDHGLVGTLGRVLAVLGVPLKELGHRGVLRLA